MLALEIPQIWIDIANIVGALATGLGLPVAVIYGTTQMRNDRKIARESDRLSRAIGYHFRIYDLAMKVHDDGKDFLSAAAQVPIELHGLTIAEMNPPEEGKVWELRRETALKMEEWAQSDSELLRSLAGGETLADIEESLRLRRIEYEERVGLASAKYEAAKREADRLNGELDRSFRMADLIIDKTSESGSAIAAAFEDCYVEMALSELDSNSIDPTTSDSIRNALGDLLAKVADHAPPPAL